LLDPLSGLSIAIVLLVPGYVHYATRRKRVPAKTLSRTMEGMSLIVVAAVANTVTLVFLTGLAQLPPVRGHAPDLAHLLRDPRGYVLLDNDRLLYVAGWTALFVVLASGISAAFAYRVGPLKYLSRQLAPALGEFTAWYHVFEENVPEDYDRIFLICELTNGGHAAGELAWYSTQPESSPDRDLVLAAPLQVRRPEEAEPEVVHEGRLVLSARDIRYIYVSYITDQ